MHFIWIILLVVLAGLGLIVLLATFLPEKNVNQNFVTHAMVEPSSVNTHATKQWTKAQLQKVYTQFTHEHPWARPSQDTELHRKVVLFKYGGQWAHGALNTVHVGDPDVLRTIHDWNHNSTSTSTKDGFIATGNYSSDIRASGPPGEPRTPV